jgi:uncharacterized protein YyaL (SSP411 family)
VSVLNLLTLAHLTGFEGAESKAERTLARYGPRIGAAARAIPMMMCALSQWHAEMGQVVIVGQRAAPRTRALTVALASQYVPFTITIPVVPGSGQQALAERLPFIASMTEGPGAAAYVCRDFTCRQPVFEPDALVEELKGATRVQ